MTTPTFGVFWTSHRNWCTTRVRNTEKLCHMLCLGIRYFKNANSYLLTIFPYQNTTYRFRTFSYSICQSCHYAVCAQIFYRFSADRITVLHKSICRNLLISLSFPQNWADRFSIMHFDGWPELLHAFYKQINFRN